MSLLQKAMSGWIFNHEADMMVSFE